MYNGKAYIELYTDRQCTKPFNYGNPRVGDYGVVAGDGEYLEATLFAKNIGTVPAYNFISDIGRVEQISPNEVIEISFTMQKNSLGEISKEFGFFYDSLPEYD